MNLTGRQQLMWLERSLDPIVASQNMIATFEIRGPLDADRFGRAFAAVVADSDALRTVFGELDGVPFQRVLPEAAAEVERLDLADAADPERAFRLWYDERRQRPFELERGAVDCALVRLGPERFVWYLGLHHLVTDGWSFSLIYRRTLAAYRGEALLARASFAEYVAHERAQRESGAHAASEAFWRERLRRGLEPMRFYGRQATRRTPYFDRRELTLGATQLARLRSVGRGARRPLPPAQSMFAAFLAVTFAYLHRTTGNRHIGIGAPMLNRSSRRFRETIGPLMEVVPFRQEIDERDTFATLLARTEAELFDVMSHVRCSVGSPARNRAFEVMFNLHNVRFEPFMGWPTRTRFDRGVTDVHPDAPHPMHGHDATEGESLLVSAHDFDGDGRLTLSFELNCDVFPEPTRDEAVAHHLRLLQSCAAEPDRRIGDVDLLSASERHRLLVAFNATDVAAPAEPATVVEAIEGRVGAHPDRVAVTDGATTISYRELGARVERLARHLVARGVGPERRVAVCLDRTVDLPVTLLGVLAAGGAYVPVDLQHPPARVAQILDDAKPALLLVSAGERARLPADVGCPIVDVDELLATPTPESPSVGPLPRDRLAYVLFTSGSTGRPKGVEITHPALLNVMLALEHALPLGEPERVLALTTITFDIAGVEIFLTLMTGGTIELVGRDVAVDGHELRATIDARKPTVVQATPATWKMLIDAGWQGDARTLLLTGGEALSPELARTLRPLGRGLFNLYGPTETTIYSTCHEVSTDGPVPIGRPLDNTRCYVLGANGAPVPAGVVGELYLGGAGVARGYLGRSELTEARFLPDPFCGEPGARMYRTGDLASFDLDGVLSYHGRADRQIKLRGFRIEPAEIETHLRRIPEVREAVVVLREVAGDQRLVAYVVGRADPALARDRLRAHVPEYMVPAHVVCMPELPVTPNGKIDVAALPAPADASSPSSAAEPPRDDLELALATIWHELLGVPEVGRHDGFFELGGHSLLAVRLLARVRVAFGRKLTLGQLFAQPTVAGLAACLRVDSAPGVGPVIVPLQPNGDAPPLFFVCGIHVYFELARALGPDQPSYGVFLPIEQRLVDPTLGSEALPTVPQLAAEYVDVIRAKQPRGPYRLAGLSFGGVLAFEVARQLRAMGEEVEALVLLDAKLPQAQRRSWWRWTWAQAKSLARLDASLLRRAWKRVTDDREQPPGPVATDDDLRQLRQRLYFGAMLDYEPTIEPYDGPVLLLRALERDRGEGWVSDETNGWGRYVTGSLAIVPVPGDHYGLVSAPHVTAVAAALRAALMAEDQRRARTRTAATATGAPPGSTESDFVAAPVLGSKRCDAT